MSVCACFHFTSQLLPGILRCCQLGHRWYHDSWFSSRPMIGESVRLEKEEKLRLPDMKIGMHCTDWFSLYLNVRIRRPKYYLPPTHWNQARKLDTVNHIRPSCSMATPAHRKAGSRNTSPVTALWNFCFTRVDTNSHVVTKGGPSISLWKEDFAYAARIGMLFAWRSSTSLPVACSLHYVYLDASCGRAEVWLWASEGQGTYT